MKDAIVWLKFKISNAQLRIASIGDHEPAALPYFLGTVSEMERTVHQQLRRRKGSHAFFGTTGNKKEKEK
tara:strand:- start:3046 stop:3255 length:210 start_codon:yes stop_codon:yes gene_type:complete